uniref:Uncharacterized protein n=1 Tax=Saccharolobus islandicus TaxID=43080 RepID=Q9HH89_SACIS|nr:hypothetical protein [Sulfolobus islandicus]CAC15844.1 hypothetical protein [Sulfolobus islandicus]
MVPVRKDKKDDTTNTSQTTSQSASSPGQIKLSINYEFNDINRAVELFQFFENTVIPFLKKRKVDDETIARLSVMFAIRINNILAEKYQQTISTINLEKAIEILDEELPNLIKQSQSSATAEDLMKAWEAIKNILNSINKR